MPRNSPVPQETDLSISLASEFRSVETAFPTALALMRLRLLGWLASGRPEGPSAAFSTSSALEKLRVLRVAYNWTEKPSTSWLILCYVRLVPVARRFMVGLAPLLHGWP